MRTFHEMTGHFFKHHVYHDAQDTHSNKCKHHESLHAGIIKTF